GFSRDWSSDVCSSDLFPLFLYACLVLVIAGPLPSVPWPGFSGSAPLRLGSIPILILAPLWPARRLHLAPLVGLRLHRVDGRRCCGRGGWRGGRKLRGGCSL